MVCGNASQRERAFLFQWITQAVANGGYTGIFLLMLAENVFPPIPSEVIMPMVGYIAAQGQLSFTGSLLAGVGGSLAGAIFWYAIGRWIGNERLKRFADQHGRWLTLTSKDIEHASAWFKKRGWTAVLIGRMIPGVRTLISVPAGVAAMPFLPFVFATAVGTCLWTGMLATAGYLLGENYRLIEGWIEPLSNGVVVVALSVYVYRVATFKNKQSTAPEQ